MDRRINWQEVCDDDVARDLFTKVFEPSLPARFGCRTVQSGSGDAVVNRELREHEWFKDFDWDLIEARLVTVRTYQDPLNSRHH